MQKNQTKQFYARPLSFDNAGQKNSESLKIVKESDFYPELELK
jgi:hypothetical protein